MMRDLAVINVDADFEYEAPSAPKPFKPIRAGGTLPSGAPGWAFRDLGAGVGLLAQPVAAGPERLAFLYCFFSQLRRTLQTADGNVAETQVECLGLIIVLKFAA